MPWLTMTVTFVRTEAEPVYEYEEEPVDEDDYDYNPKMVGGDGVAGGGLRDAEIRHLYLSVLGNDDVLGLDVIEWKRGIPCIDWRTYMVKIGMMIGDRYEVLEKIGTGGMSDVYKAKCHKQPGLFLDIFLEGDALHKLHDDIIDAILLAHIVHVHDIGMHQSWWRPPMRTAARTTSALF
mgnify:CR=1 FL=1